MRPRPDFGGSSVGAGSTHACVRGSAVSSCLSRVSAGLPKVDEEAQLILLDGESGKGYPSREPRAKVVFYLALTLFVAGWYLVVYWTTVVP